ncbi:hypothetical protein DITRI_Ditri10aG0089700 [Diplodiscus trichospermus]
METSVPQRRRTPSFSSSLLDAIYRSIDESSNGDEATLCHYGETKKTLVKKQNNASLKEERKVSSLGRAIMIENWVEKQNSHGSAVRFNSTSSSSDSSSGGIFSSSEAESIYKEKSRRSTPAKLDKSMQFESRNLDNSDNNQQKAKREGGGFTKTKLKALKIYGELKKVKQPISPGARITNFLNSIFNANSKKVKMCSVGASDDVSFERKSKSTCSSATSFSRSCLSKTPCSRGNKYSNGKKRSVKFCPVSVIVDEDCRPCGHKCIYEDDPSLMPTSTVQKIAKSSSRKEELKNFGMEKESGVSNKAKDYLRNYQRRGTGKLDLRGFIDDYEEDNDDEDADALSYSSSDLFELDHLIGIGRYREELPVYETTSLKTNKAIANGFIS